MKRRATKSSVRINGAPDYYHRRIPDSDEIDVESSGIRQAMQEVAANPAMSVPCLEAIAAMVWDGDYVALRRWADHYSMPPVRSERMRRLADLVESEVRRLAAS